MNLTNLWGRAIKRSVFDRSVDGVLGAMRQAVRPFGQPRSRCALGRHGRAVALAALAVLALAAAENAAAQSVTTLVSNVGQGQTVDSANAYTMTIDVTDDERLACGVPDIEGDDRHEILSGTMTVEILGALATYYGFDSRAGSLSDRTFSIDSTDHTIDLILVKASGTPKGNLIINLDSGHALTATERAALRLHVCGTDYDFSAAIRGPATYSWAGSLDWSPPVVTRTVYLSLPGPNPNPNAEPTAADNTVTTGVDTAYTFTADDFGFADTDLGDTLARVRILTLPAPGTLALAGWAVVADQVVTRARIDAGDLTFTPVTGASGVGYASFTFKVDDGKADSDSAYTMTIDAPVTNTSSDATLSALALEDASDDSAITISPTFASGTTSYTASVDNGVDEITIKPTVNESNATVAYLDSSDTAITDADAMKDDQQVSLDVGTNTIKVKVTAEDTTTNPYTVVVMRAAAMPSANALVSNLGQTAGGVGQLGVVDLAQPFTTGTNATGYTLTSIELPLNSSQSTDTPTVKLYSGSANGTEVATFTGPAMLDASVNYTFTPSLTVTLGMSTTYWVVAEANTGNARWVYTASTSEDATPAAGWEIGDVAEVRTASSTGSFSTDFGAIYKIRVNGTLGGIVISSDATLSALALEDASDDSPITISPTFASGTTSYTASVDNDVDEITIAPTVNESNATIEYLDSTDTKITDADSGKTGQQVSLSEGENTIKVKVTAEDTTTTNPYTVVVTRAAASTNAVPTAANKTVTTGVGTAYTFTADDFGFADTDAGATLARVRIVTLPTAGTLELGGTAVTTDQVVTKADIDAGDLIFTPVTGASGAGYASFTFKVNDGTVDSASTYTMTIDVTATTTGITTGQRSPPSTPPPPPGDVVGYLENPGAASFQSGIGVISGWVCDAEEVEIVLNGEPQEAAYGTARLDTEAVCGDSDNGFGLLFNWNLLGDGEHEVVALVDGVELDRATVTVTTLGTEFLQDVTGTCTAADFPTGDETVTLAWQQTQQNFVIAEGAAPAGANRAGTPGVGYLENPGPNSYQSGIGVLSGWACERTEVVIELNGQPQPAAYGTERLDTLEMCGDTANGFGLLFNWNLLGEGEHEVVAFVDGEELGRATVRVTTLGAEFVRDVEGECVVEDFPMLGETVTLEWQQNSQNFVIMDVE